MSSISAMNADAPKSVEHEKPKEVAPPEVIGSQNMAAAENSRRAREAVKDREMTVLFSAYTGKGSIINNMA